MVRRLRPVSFPLRRRHSWRAFNPLAVNRGRKDCGIVARPWGVVPVRNEPIRVIPERVRLPGIPSGASGLQANADAVARVPDRVPWGSFSSLIDCSSRRSRTCQQNQRNPRKSPCWPWNPGSESCPSGRPLRVRNGQMDLRDACETFRVIRILPRQMLPIADSGPVSIVKREPLPVRSCNF